MPLNDACLLLIATGLLLGCGERADKPERPTPREPIPELDDPRLDEAMQLVGAGDYAAARGILLELREQQPEAVRVRFFLGLTYHKEGRYDLAREQYEAIVPRGPVFEDYYKAQYFYGWSLYNLGEVERARRSFEVFLEDEPGSSDAQFALGLIDFDGGRLNDAERRFQRAISLAGAPAAVAKARTRLADVYIRQGRLEDAKKELEQAVALRPQQYNAYYKLHQVALQLGLLDEAREALAHFEAWKARLGR